VSVSFQPIAHGLFHSAIILFAEIGNRYLECYLLIRLIIRE